MWEKLPFFSPKSPEITFVVPGFHTTKRTRILCDLLHWTVSLSHVWASLSKLNFITWQIFQPLINYSLPELMYDTISKWLASSELRWSPNDAGYTPEGSRAARLLQPLVCTRNVGVSMRANPHFNISRVTIYAIPENMSHGSPSNNVLISFF